MAMTKEQVLEIAITAGKILLCSGAETYRVEDTIVRMCNLRGMDTVSVFCTPSVIIVSNEVASGFTCMKLGWKHKGTLDEVAPGKSIGGDKFGNFEDKLPVVAGRTYRECDIDYIKGNRGSKRIIFSNDGNIYYSGDHYKNFEKLY